MNLFKAGVLGLTLIAVLVSGCSNDHKALPVNTVKKPQRIVSLVLGADEILTDLVPVSSIAALSHLSIDEGISNVADKAWQVPARIKGNAETVISLHPDLVITTDYHPVELIQTIQDAGIPVLVYKTPGTIEEIKQSIRQIAAVVGEEAAGARMVAEMEAAISQVGDKIKYVPAEKRLTVLRFSLLGGGGGKGTLFDDICGYAGVTNGASIVGLGRHEILSKEQIVLINPDMFFVPTWDYNQKTNFEQYRADIQNDPALQPVRAVKTQKLVMVPDRHLVCASQYIVYGVRDIARAAYPEYLEKALEK